MLGDRRVHVEDHRAAFGSIHYTTKSQKLARANGSCFVFEASRRIQGILGTVKRSAQGPFDRGYPSKVSPTRDSKPGCRDHCNDLF